MRNDSYVIETLTEGQLSQLLEMYKNEWWSKERKAESVMIMLKNGIVGFKDHLGAIALIGLFFARL